MNTKALLILLLFVIVPYVFAINYVPTIPGLAGKTYTGLEPIAVDNDGNTVGLSIDFNNIYTRQFDGNKWYLLRSQFYDTNFETYPDFNKAYVTQLDGNGWYVKQLDGNSWYQFAISTDCSAGNYVYGVQDDGTLLCSPDLIGITFYIDTNWQTSFPLLDYNLSNYYWHQTDLNLWLPLNFVSQVDGNVWYLFRNQFYDTNWQTSFNILDSNLSLTYYKQTDANAVFWKQTDLNTYLPANYLLRSQFYDTNVWKSKWLMPDTNKLVADWNFGSKTMTGKDFNAEGMICLTANSQMLPSMFCLDVNSTDLRFKDPNGTWTLKSLSIDTTGGGSGDLNDAYNNGREITAESGAVTVKGNTDNAFLDVNRSRDLNFITPLSRWINWQNNPAILSGAGTAAITTSVNMFDINNAVIANGGTNQYNTIQSNWTIDNFVFFVITENDGDCTGYTDGTYYVLMTSGFEIGSRFNILTCVSNGLGSWNIITNPVCEFCAVLDTFNVEQRTLVLSVVTTTGALVNIDDNALMAGTAGTGILDLNHAIFKIKLNTAIAPSGNTVVDRRQTFNINIPSGNTGNIFDITSAGSGNIINISKNGDGNYLNFSRNGILNFSVDKDGSTHIGKNLDVNGIIDNNLTRSDSLTLGRGHSTTGLRKNCSGTCSGGVPQNTVLDVNGGVYITLSHKPYQYDPDFVILGPDAGRFSVNDQFQGSGVLISSWDGGFDINATDTNFIAGAVEFNNGTIQLTNTSTYGKLNLFNDIAINNSSYGVGNGGSSLNNNIDVNNYSMISLTGATAAFQITGIQADAAENGTLLFLYNRTTKNMTIEDQNAFSKANAQFITNTGSDLLCTGNCAVLMFYNAADKKWAIIGTLG